MKTITRPIGRITLAILMLALSVTVGVTTAAPRRAPWPRPLHRRRLFIRRHPWLAVSGAPSRCAGACMR